MDWRSFDFGCSFTSVHNLQKTTTPRLGMKA
jgi:hypothetical protein